MRQAWRPRVGIALIALLLPVVAGFWLVLRGTFMRAAQADTERSLSALMNQADRLVWDLDLELSLLDGYLAGQDADQPIERAADSALQSYRDATRWPGLVNSLYLVDRSADGAVRILRLAPGGDAPDLADIESLLTQFGLAGPEAALGSAPPSRVMAVRVQDSDSGGRSARFIVAVLNRDVLSGAAMASLAASYFGQDSGFREYDIVVRDASGRVRFGTPPADGRPADFQRPLFRESGRFDVFRFYFSFIPHDPAERGLAQGELERPIDRLRFQTDELKGAWTLDVYRRGLSVELAEFWEARLWTAGSAGILTLLYGSVVALYAAARRARELASRERSFVASVTHELKTPIAVALSAAENLEKGIVPDGKVAAYGGVVAKEARRLSSSVDRLLAVAGLESAQSRPGGEPFPLADAVRQAADALAQAASSKGAVIDIEEDGRPEVAGSRVLVEAAVECVLGNAVAYAGGRVRVRVGRLPGRKALAYVRCQDSGPGIPADERRRIFEPFYRGRAAAETGAPGTGVGLYLARKAAQLHGGHAKLELPPEGGLVVTLSFRSVP
ncbi:MAG: HAMP domain-containing histidine kinase [Spirochaetales bacterium]|nr:HAMP domain-containing histidine kinase [Spirochaetales bacterium]